MSAFGCFCYYNFMEQPKGVQYKAVGILGKAG